MLPAFAAVRGRVAAAGDDIADTVAAFVCGLTEVMKAHPWWPQLWVREVLCDGGALRDLLVTRIAPPIPRPLADRFAPPQHPAAHHAHPEHGNASCGGSVGPND